MNDERSNIDVTTQANSSTSALSPIIGFAAVLFLEAWLLPPKPPAPDAGPIETWITFVLANALIFGVIFAVALSLFWLSARITTKRPSPWIQHFPGAALVATSLLLLSVAAQWYGRQGVY